MRETQHRTQVIGVTFKNDVGLQRVRPLATIVKKGATEQDAIVLVPQLTDKSFCPGFKPGHIDVTGVDTEDYLVATRCLLCNSRVTQESQEEKGN